MDPTNRSPSEPRPAATIVILRDGADGPEVLLTERPQHLRFMGGAVVFPGGALAEADRDPAWERASALNATRASELLEEPDPDLALGMFVAALREAFEEIGFVAGTGPIERLRRADSAAPGRFLERCLELGVVLATDGLVPAGRWVTPAGASIRFDARFFLVPAPEGWTPTPDESEVAAWRWSTPSAALKQLASGEILMAPPTVEMLQRLSVHPSMAEALESMRSEPGIGTARVLSVRLAPDVHVVLAPNPSLMTGPGTNTYVVGTSRTAVIDPAVDDPEYLDAVLAAAGTVERILITHRHIDHVGGIAPLVERTGARVYAFGPELAGGVATEPVRDDELIEVGGARLRALHTPGHASDHLCFLMEDSASLFAGDNILGEGTAVIAPPDGDMRAYLQSLERLRSLSIDRIYPGHFRPLGEGAAVIDRYLAHRAERVDAIVAAIRSSPLTVEEIVAAVYTDTPSGLHGVAAWQVLGTLEMLAEDGRIANIGERWSLRDVEIDEGMT